VFKEVQFNYAYVLEFHVISHTSNANGDDISCGRAIIQCT